MKKIWFSAACLMLLSGAVWAQAPGGVSTGLKLWLKADAGVTTNSSGVAKWNDQSGGNHHFYQMIPFREPAYNTSATTLKNFNPTIAFDSINKTYLYGASVFGATPVTNVAMFTVGEKKSRTTSGILSEKTVASSFELNPAFDNGKTYWDGDSTSRISPAVSPTLPDYTMYSGVNTPTSQSLRRNGLQIASGSMSTSFTSMNDSAFLGYKKGNTWCYNGTINEVIVYTSPLTETEIQKIQTYNALKWGIGLDQSTAYNYLATDGSVVWNATTNSSYNKYISGIAVDSAEALVQKQSRNAESMKSLVSIGLGTLATTNALNAGTFENDKSYLVWSSNSDVVTVGNADLPATYSVGQRLTQEWKVQTTNFNNATKPVSVRFDLSSGTGITGVLGTAATDFKLLIDVDGDGDFTTGTVLEVAAATFASNTVTFTGVTQLTNGAVFTLLTKPAVIAPGGVTVGLLFWLRGDAGITSASGQVSQWNDQSPRSLNFTQSTNTAKPLINSDSLINYNPAVVFTGNKTMDCINSVLDIGTYTTASLFSLTKSNTASSGCIMYMGTQGPGSIGMYMQPDTAGDVKWDAIFSSSQTKAIGWGATNRGKPTLLACTRTTGDHKILANGILAGTGTGTQTFTASGSAPILGKGFATASFFTGLISEMALYSTNVTGTDLKKIQTYHAIKYGLTLDQTTAYDYMATDGSVIWSATGNGTYNKNIAGIGRDDIEGLTQKQSRSSNQNGIVSVGLGSVAASNPGNTNTFAGNRSYMTWASNSNVATTSTTDLPAGAYSNRLDQEWKVQTTNFNNGTQPVELKFDLTGISGLTGNTANHFRLLIDNDGDGDFTTGTPTVIPATGYGSNAVTVNNVTGLNNGAVFTLANIVVPTAPGGVTNGLKLWLRADTGIVTATGVSQWNDMSGNGNNFIQATGAAQPQYNTSTALTNFNPSIGFAAGKSLTKATGILGAGTYNVTSVFSVSVPDSLRDAPLFSEETATPSSLLSLTAPGNGTASWNGPQSVGVSAAWGGTTGNPYLWSGVNGNNSQNLRRNGLQIAGSTLTATSFSGNNNTAYIGHNTSAPDYFSGLIHEVIMYTDTLSALDVQKIQTYNALKYGITLDQTTAANYVNVEGNVVWNATTNSTYNKNIAGIVSENAEALVQKQSRSGAASAIVTLGIGTLAASNAANTTPFASDRSYLIWGSSNTAMSTQTADLPTSFASGQRLTQEWKVQASNFTNATSPVSFQFDLSAIPAVSGGTLADFSLLIDSDGDGNFGTGTVTTVPATALSGNTITISGVTQLTNGAVFTLLTKRATYAPGGVTAGLSLWLKADMGIVTGTGINRWADQTLNGNHFSQPSSGNQPVYNTASGLQNFNPTVSFNAASNQALIRTSGMLGNSTYNAVSLFTVSQNATLNNGSVLFEHTAPGTSGTFELTPGHTNGNAYWDGDQTTQVSAAWGGTMGTPYLWSGLNASNSQSLRRNGLQIAGASNSTSFAGAGNNAWMGYSDATAGYFNGNINELIMYNTALSPTDIQKINTYTAIKWGLSLDQTTPANYLATDGSIVWNAATNGAYNQNIAGIAKDSVENLLQKQSRSVNSSSILSLGIGSLVASNAANTGVFAGDKSYLTWASNGTATTTQVTELPVALCNISERLAQEWKIQTTNFTNTTTPVQLKFDLNGITGVTGTAVSSFTLLIDKDGDGDFTTGPQATIPAVAFAGNVVTFNNVTSLKNGTIFTLGTMKTTAGSGLAPFVPADATNVTTSVQCYNSGWLYFIDPTNSSNYIAAINDPNLLIDPTKISVTVNTSSAYTDLGEGNSSDASRLMRRMLQITCNNCFDTVANPTPNFTVRFLYSTPEKTAARSTETNNLAAIKLANGLSANDTFYWFKASGDIASVLPTLTPEGIPLTVGTMWPQATFFNNGSVCDFSGINRFSVFGGLWKTLPNMPLATNLEQFEGRAVENCMTEISWKLSPESKCKTIDIHYGTDGRTFNNAGTLAANASNTFRYKQPDNIGYYRLQLTDEDGEMSFSNIVKVTNNCITDDFNVGLYPNPAKGNATIEISATDTRNVSVMVYNAAGQLITPASSHAVVKKSNITLNTGSWTPGIYHIVIRDEITGATKTRTLVKL
jgi:hypothetical protein